LVASGSRAPLAQPQGADQRQNRDDDHHGPAPVMPKRLLAASLVVPCGTSYTVLHGTNATSLRACEVKKP
jgi:hypothetical protein